MSQSPTRIAFGMFAVTALLTVSQAHTSGDSSSHWASAPAAYRSLAPDSSARDRIRTEYLRTPLRFERDTRRAGANTADFVARGLGYAMFLSSGHATIVLGAPDAKSADAVTMRLLGSDANAQVTGRSELPGHTNHFMGNDPRHWQTGVRSFGRIEYRGVYPGVDLVYYGNQRQLEYDFIVAPGGSPEQNSFYGRRGKPGRTRS